MTSLTPEEQKLLRDSAGYLVNQIQQLLQQRLYKDADTAAEKMLVAAYERGRTQPQAPSAKSENLAASAQRPPRQRLNKSRL